MQQIQFRKRTGLTIPKINNAPQKKQKDKEQSFNGGTCESIPQQQSPYTEQQPLVMGLSSKMTADVDIDTKANNQKSKPTAAMPINNQKSLIKVIPQEIVFRDIESHQLYEIPFYIRNESREMQKIRIIPPIKERFKIRYTEESNQHSHHIHNYNQKPQQQQQQNIYNLAPGLSIKGSILFCSNDDDIADDSRFSTNSNFHDRVTILGNSFKIEMPLSACAPKQMFQIPQVINAGTITAKTKNKICIPVKNIGSVFGILCVSECKSTKAYCPDIQYEDKCYKLAPQKMENIELFVKPIIYGELTIEVIFDNLQKCLINALVVEDQVEIFDGNGSRLQMKDFGEVMVGQRLSLPFYVVNGTKSEVGCLLQIFNKRKELVDVKIDSKRNKFVGFGSPEALSESVRNGFCRLEKEEMVVKEFSDGSNELEVYRKPSEEEISFFVGNLHRNSQKVKYKEQYIRCDNGNGSSLLNELNHNNNTELFGNGNESSRSGKATNNLLKDVVSNVKESVQVHETMVVKFSNSDKIHKIPIRLFSRIPNVEIVDSDEFDFGEVKRKEQRTKTFSLKNNSNKRLPLTLYPQDIWSKEKGMNRKVKSSFVIQGSEYLQANCVQEFTIRFRPLVKKQFQETIGLKVYNSYPIELKVFGRCSGDDMDGLRRLNLSCENRFNQTVGGGASERNFGGSKSLLKNSMSSSRLMNVNKSESNLLKNSFCGRNNHNMVTNNLMVEKNNRERVQGIVIGGGSCDFKIKKKSPMSMKNGSGMKMKTSRQDASIKGSDNATTEGSMMKDFIKEQVSNPSPLFFKKEDYLRKMNRQIEIEKGTDKKAIEKKNQENIQQQATTNHQNKNIISKNNLKEILKYSSHPLTPQQLSCIKISSDLLDYGHIFIGSKIHKTLTITNTFQQEPILFEIDTGNHAPLNSNKQQLIKISPYETYELKIQLNPIQLGQIDLPLTYIINRQHIFQLKVQAIVTLVNLELSTRAMMFHIGEDEPIFQKSETLEIYNSGNQRTRFVFDSPENKSFRLLPMEGELEPKSRMAVEVVYCPKNGKMNGSGVGEINNGGVSSGSGLQTAVEQQQQRIEVEKLRMKVSGGAENVIKCTGTVREAKIMVKESEFCFDRLLVCSGLNGKITLKNLSKVQTYVKVSFEEEQQLVVSEGREKNNTQNNNCSPQQHNMRHFNTQSADNNQYCSKNPYHYELQFDRTIYSIDADEKKQINFSFVSQKVQKVSGNIVLQIRGYQNLYIPFSVNVMYPQIKVSPSVIDFGEVPVMGNNCFQRFTLQNMTNTEIKLQLDQTNINEYSLEFFAISSKQGNDLEVNFADDLNCRTFMDSFMGGSQLEGRNRQNRRLSKRKSLICNKIINLAPMSGQMSFCLKFVPKKIKEYNFQVPFRVVGTSDRYPKVFPLQMKILCHSIDSIIYVEPQSINFETKVICETKTSYKKSIVIMNPHDHGIRFAIEAVNSSGCSMRSDGIQMKESGSSMERSSERKNTNLTQSQRSNKNKNSFVGIIEPKSRPQELLLKKNQHLKELTDDSFVRKGESSGGSKSAAESKTKVLSFSQQEGIVQSHSKVQIVVNYRPVNEGLTLERFNIVLSSIVESQLVNQDNSVAICDKTKASHSLVKKSAKNPVPPIITNNSSSPSSILSTYLFEIRGDAILPTIKFNCNQVIMPVVPLNMQSRVFIMIENHGYDAISICKWKTTHHFANTDLKVNFIEGKLLSLAKKNLRIEIIFSSNTPISFTTIFQLYDEYGNRYQIPLSCTADNSIFTSYGYIESDNQHTILYSGQQKVIKIVPTGKNSYYDPNKQLSGNHSMSCEFIKKWLSFQLSINVESFPECFIESEGRKFVQMVNRMANKMIVRRFEVPEEEEIMMMGRSRSGNNNMRSTNTNPNLSSSFSQFQQQQQQQQQHSVQQDNLMMNCSFSPQGSTGYKLSKILTIIEMYSQAIKKLKSEGAFLNQIRPEFLLSYSDYVSYMDSKKLLICSESMFEVLSVESWIVIFYQLCKVYVEPQVNERILQKMKIENINDGSAGATGKANNKNKNTNTNRNGNGNNISNQNVGVTNTAATTTNYSSVGIDSNLYSTVEISILKFINQYLSRDDNGHQQFQDHNHQSKSNSNPKTINGSNLLNMVSMTQQIKIFQVLQKILQMNFSLNLSEQINSMKNAVSLMSPHVFLSSISRFLHGQLKEYGLSAYLSSSQLFTMGSKELFLYFISLIQMIYHYNNANSVKFEGSVGDRITKVIELENPTSKMIKYGVKIMHQTMMENKGGKVLGSDGKGVNTAVMISASNSPQLRSQAIPSLIEMSTASIQRKKKTLIQQPNNNNNNLEPSSSPLDYDQQQQQSFFICSQSQITIEPKSKAQLKVLYHCKNAQQSHGQLYLIPQKQDQLYGTCQPLMFKLSTSIVSKVVMDRIYVSSGLYEVMPIHLDVELPSQIPEMTEFGLSVIEEQQQQQEKEKQKFSNNSQVKGQHLIQPTFPSFIFNQSHSRSLSSGNRDSIEIKLIPLTLGDKLCKISYQSSMYGEFIYEIHAKITPPKIIKEIKIKDLKVLKEEQIDIMIPRENQLLSSIVKGYYPEVYYGGNGVRGTERNINGGSGVSKRNIQTMRKILLEGNVNNGKESKYEVEIIQHRENKSGEDQNVSQSSIQIVKGYTELNLSNNKLDQNKQSRILLKTNFTKPCKDYSVTLSVKNSVLNDYRLYRLVFNAISAPKVVKMQFRTPSKVPLTQKLPTMIAPCEVNLLSLKKGGENENGNIENDSSNNGNNFIIENYCRQYQTNTDLICTFEPNWIMEKEVRIEIFNRETLQRLIYQISLRGDEPQKVADWKIWGSGVFEENVQIPVEIGVFEKLMLTGEGENAKDKEKQKQRDTARSGISTRSNNYEKSSIGVNRNGGAIKKDRNLCFKLKESIRRPHELKKSEIYPFGGGVNGNGNRNQKNLTNFSTLSVGHKQQQQSKQGIKSNRNFPAVPKGNNKNKTPLIELTLDPCPSASKMQTGCIKIYKPQSQQYAWINLQISNRPITKLKPIKIAQKINQVREFYLTEDYQSLVEGGNVNSTLQERVSVMDVESEDFICKFEHQRLDLGFEIREKVQSDNVSIGGSRRSSELSMGDYCLEKQNGNGKPLGGNVTKKTVGVLIFSPRKEILQEQCVNLYFRSNDKEYVLPIMLQVEELPPIYVPEITTLNTESKFTYINLFNSSDVAGVYKAIMPSSCNIERNNKLGINNNLVIGGGKKFKNGSLMTTEKQRNQCFKLYPSEKTTIIGNKNQTFNDEDNKSLEMKTDDCILLYHLQPKQKKEVKVEFKPLYVNQKQKTQIRFESDNLPNYTYVLNGRSQFSVQEEDLSFEIFEEDSKPCGIIFQNLFRRKEMFSIEIENVQGGSGILGLQEPLNGKFVLPESNSKNILFTVKRDRLGREKQVISDSSGIEKVKVLIKMGEKVVKIYNLSLSVIKDLLFSGRQIQSQEKSQQSSELFGNSPVRMPNKNILVWNCKARQTIFESIELSSSLCFNLKDIECDKEIRQYLSFSCVDSGESCVNSRRNTLKQAEQLMADKEKQNINILMKEKTSIQRSGSNSSRILKLKFSPLKPLKKKSYDLILIGTPLCEQGSKSVLKLQSQKSSQSNKQLQLKYRLKCQIYVNEPPIDDIITIKTSDVNQMGCVGFKLTNTTKSNAKYRAYFEKKIPEFSLEHYEGVLEGYGKPGTSIVVRFKSHINNRRLQDYLIVQTEEMYWRFKIKGHLSKENIGGR